MSEGIIRIYENNEQVFIHNLAKNSLISIDRSYLSISPQKTSILNEIEIMNCAKSFGILGLLQIGMLDFLLFISSSEKVGEIGSTEIHQVKEVDFILISHEKVRLSSEIKYMIEGIKNLFHQGFYYSFTFDLTNTIQEQKNIKIKNNNTYNIITDCNKDFMWNENLCDKFRDYHIDTDFIVNCICGYVGIFSEMLPDSTSLHYILISRRRIHNAGIKSFKRGLDCNGNCSNYVETESIMINNKNIFSYVQIRGTAPVDYKPGMNMNMDMNITAFDKHIQHICEVYKMLFIVNLMTNSKQNENLLIEKYEAMIKKMNYQNVKYLYFDYEMEVNNNNNNLTHPFDIISFDYPVTQSKADPLDIFLSKIESICNMFKFFAMYDTFTQWEKTKMVIDQIGVIRINCFDGLEKTNTIEMRIAWKMLLMQLNLIGIDGMSLFGNDFTSEDVNMGGNRYDLLNEIFTCGQFQFESKNVFSSCSKPYSSFLRQFKEAWRENNERLSLQYNGGCTNDNDEQLQFQQKCIDVLLQKIGMNIKNVSDEMISKELENLREKFTVSEELTVFIGTWNVGALKVSSGEQLNLEDWLNPSAYKDMLPKPPDMYVIGMQEIVELNVNSLLLSTNEPMVNYWKNRMKTTLDRIDKYVIIV